MTTATSNRRTGAANPVGMVGTEYVARRLGIHINTVSGLIRAGKLPRPVRVGRLWRWERAIVEHWIASGCPAVDAGDAEAEGPRRAG